MERYAIIKDGRDFIVQSDEQSILKCTSRRTAARIVADAKDLMRADSASAPMAPENNEADNADEIKI